MITSFKILFEVNLLHHYLLNEGSMDYEGMSEDDKLKKITQYNIQDIFEIAPTDETRLRANGSKLRLKNTPTGFLVAASVDPSDDTKPFFDFTGRQKLSFNIFFKDSSLYNYSSLPLSENSGRIYHFTNLDKVSAQFPNLAGMPSEFDATLAATLAGDGDPDTFAYQPGDFVIDNSSDPTDLFEAIRSTNNNTATVTDWRKDSPAAEYDGAASYSEGDTVLYNTAGKDGLYKALEDVTGVDPTDATRWEKLWDLPFYYVNKEDRMTVLGPLYTFEFSGPGLNYTFDVLDPFDNVIKSVTETSTEEILTLELDMRPLNTGVFKMRITDNSGPSIVEEFPFYLLRKPTRRSLFGVIDIYSGDDQGEYSLVDSSNNFLSPSFLLRFKNRSTVWRYIDSRSKAVLHESNFNPLTYSGIVDVPFDGNNLPNPGIRMIKPEPAQYYSEIYL